MPRIISWPASPRGFNYFFRAIILRDSFVSAHSAEFVGLDFVYDPLFTGLPERVDVFAQIFLGQAVDVIIRALLGGFDDFAANLQVAVGILRVLNGQRDARIASDVFVLQAATRGIDAHVFAIVVDPYRGHLRTAIAV